MTSARAGAVEVTQPLENSGPAGGWASLENKFWDTEQGLELAGPRIWGLGKSWVGRGVGQPHVGAHSEPHTPSGTWLDWRGRREHPHNHLLGDAVPSPFRTEEQRPRGVRSSPGCTASGGRVGLVSAPSGPCVADPRS